eukprot:Gb_18385 [translate_table: standard]
MAMASPIFLKMPIKIFCVINNSPVIRLPSLQSSGQKVSLGQAVPFGQPLMSKDEATALLIKVVGWRIVEENDRLMLQCLWKRTLENKELGLKKAVAARKDSIMLLISIRQMKPTK